MPLLFLLVHLAGCERGCLAKRIAVDAGPPLLGDMIDCPDGLARCRGGSLERSRLAQVSSRAPLGCPWEATATCPSECVETAIVPEENAKQLCKTTDVIWIDKQGPAHVEDCESGSKWACAAAEVLDCQNKQTVAVCLRGCALSELDDDVTVSDAKTILCKR